MSVVPRSWFDKLTTNGGLIQRSLKTVAPDSPLPGELRRAALYWLSCTDAGQKSAGVRLLARDWVDAKLTLEPAAHLQESSPIPGYPQRPELVSPRVVPRRAMHTPEGRAAMIHALTHIEFNAINLALDALWRFPDMPQQYYVDWLQVADEEALHFDLLSAHLQTLGYAYGDFPAHNGLWEWARLTQGDVLARMALLPRTMEARGLDVTPGMKARLEQAGDTAVGAIMDVILRDEIGHVALGNRWFNWLCTQRGLAPEATYRALAVEYQVPVYRGPLNLAARRAAGFSEQELMDMHSTA